MARTLNRRDSFFFLIPDSFFFYTYNANDELIRRKPIFRANIDGTGHTRMEEPGRELGALTRSAIQVGSDAGGSQPCWRVIAVRSGDTRQWGRQLFAAPAKDHA